MLTEIKNRHHHYFEDENGDVQGEFKSWHNNGQLEVQCFYVDNKVHGEYKVCWDDGNLRGHLFVVNGIRHGEYKEWTPSGNIHLHCFYVNGIKVPFDELPYPPSLEDRVYFMLKYDLQLLPVEMQC